MEELDREIGKLEESMRRMDDCDEDEVDPDEYQTTLRRLVSLRDRREARHRMTAKLERSKAIQRKRIEELQSFGIAASPGYGVMGSITIGATAAAKLIRLLKKKT